MSVFINRTSVFLPNKPVSIENKKNEIGISLAIEWIELFSFANKRETCMYMGADKQADGSLKNYQHFSPGEISQKSVLSLEQDIKLLGCNVVELGFNGLKSILEIRGKLLLAVPESSRFSYAFGLLKVC